MTLLKLQLQNFLGLNVYFHTKDKSAKHRQNAVMVSFLILIGYVLFMLSMQSYALIRLGGSHLVPQIQGISGMLVIFLLSLFDRSLFSSRGYEILLSLPVRKSAIAGSRMAGMYLKYLLLGLLVSLPEIIVYSLLVEPIAVVGYLGLVLIPVLPLSLSILLTTAIQAVSCRCVHRTGVQTGLTVLVAIAVFAAPLLTMGIPSLPKDPQMLLSLVEQPLQKQFPHWLRMWPLEAGAFLLYTVFSLAAGAAIWVLITGIFGSLMKKLGAVSRKHSAYSAAHRSSSLLKALYKKEAKGYFSSSLYVSNTVIGPILATICAIALLFVGPEHLPLQPNSIAPAWCAICCMMNPAAVNISMEGNRVWILKSLPIPMKSIVNAKLLWSLTLTGPACLISYVVLMITNQGAHWLWYLMIMPTMVIFSAVFALAVNLHLQNFQWQKEEEVVKQSAASLIGGLVPSLLCLVIALIVQMVFNFLVELLIVLLVLIATAYLYFHCRSQHLN